MTYVDRPRPASGPPWAHNSLGASVHSALAGWWRLPRERRRSGDVDALVDQAWSAEGFRDAEQSERWRSRARAMVRRYVGTLDPDNEPVGVERTLGARTSVLALSGRVDRLDDREGELVVVDYKTGRRALGPDDTRGALALALYAITAAATLRRPCRRVELHHVPTGEVHAHEYTDESLGRQLRRAEQIATDVAAAVEAVGVVDPADEPPPADLFPPRPGAQCGWCDLRAHCPEGAAAGPRRLPWDALGDLESTLSGVTAS